MRPNQCFPGQSCENLEVIAWRVAESRNGRSVAIQRREMSSESRFSSTASTSSRSLPPTSPETLRTNPSRWKSPIQIEGDEENRITPTRYRTCRSRSDSTGFFLHRTSTLPNRIPGSAHFREEGGVTKRRDQGCDSKASFSNSRLRNGGWRPIIVHLQSAVSGLQPPNALLHTPEYWCRYSKRRLL